MDVKFKTDTIALKKIMIEKQISSVTELSVKSKVNRNTLYKVLHGRIQPSSDVMGKLVNTLDIEPENAGRIFFAINLRNK